MFERECIVNDKSKLNELVELTKTFDFSSFVIPINNTKIQMRVDEGEIVIAGLLNIDQISIANCIAKQGTICNTHTHEQFEVFVVYEGQMILTDNEKEFIINQGELRYVDSKSPHSAFFPVKCKLIAITIPKSDDFPNHEDGVVPNGN